MGIDFKSINWREQVFPERKNLPSDLTYTDLLKTLAVALMVIDHVGYYLFPEYLWFRVFGRLCVPIWFFLIGYAGPRAVPWRWYAGAAVLFVASLLVGAPVLPVSALITMAIIRYGIGHLWAFMQARPYYFWWFVLLLAFFGYLSDKLVEYGTMGVLLAGAGYAFRHADSVNEGLGQGFTQVFLGVVLTIFGTLECLIFGFSMVQAMVLASGLAGLYFVFHDFAPRVLPNTALAPHAALVRFTGRYTFEIYIIHLLLLNAVFGLKMLSAAIL